MFSRLRKINAPAPRLRLAALALAVLTTAIGAGIAATAGAEKARVLGKSKAAAKPSCPDKPNTGAIECEITGQVTGFQRAIRGKANVFKAGTTGKIVAWSIHLSKPSKAERNTFGEAAAVGKFGESPTAGISILRKVGSGKFKLIRSSPVLEVQRYYGTKPTFTLAQPLRIRKGDIVGLTTATWLPAFAVKGQRKNDVWMGSRAKKNCMIPKRVPPKKRLKWFFDHTRAHRKVGTTRRYACRYDSARLMYWAYLSPL